MSNQVWETLLFLSGLLRKPELYLNYLKIIDFLRLLTAGGGGGQAAPSRGQNGHGHGNHKNKVQVHIHGTNGAKFNGTNFFGTREPTCTYEEWHNPTSVYNATLKAEKNNGNNGNGGGGHRHRRSKSTSADRPKPGPDFHAVHLGKQKEGQGHQ